MAAKKQVNKELAELQAKLELAKVKESNMMLEISALRKQEKIMIDFIDKLRDRLVTGSAKASFEIDTLKKTLAKAGYPGRVANAAANIIPSSSTDTD